MCHIEKITPEAATMEQALAGQTAKERIVVSREDVAGSTALLNGHPKDRIDYISLGCPHYHIDEIRRIAEFLDGRPLQVYG
jgi:hypothetical protein